MIDAPEILQRWAQICLPVLLDAAVKGTILLMLAGLVVAAMRKASAAARQVAWMVALVAMLAMPLASALLPGWQVLPGWARLEMPAQVPPQTANKGPDTTKRPAQAVVADTKEQAQPTWHGPISNTPTTLPSDVELVAGSPVASATVVPPSADPPSAPTPAPAQDAPRQDRPWWLGVLAWVPAVWLAGVIVCLAPLVLGRLSLWRLARSSRRIDSGPWMDLASRAADAVGLRRPVALLLSDKEPMPLVWGIFRPKLLLPAEAETWPEDRRWVVLLHELGHARRRDCLAKLIAHVACAAHWFNPLAWLAFVWMQRDAEAACDDLVLASGHRPSDYATHLLEIASGLKSGMLAAYSSIAMARKSKLEGRLLAILDPTRSRRRLTLLLAMLAALLGTAVLVPLSILRARDATADKPVTPEPMTHSDSATAAPATQPELKDVIKVSLFAERDSLYVGEPMILWIRIVNTSDQPLVIPVTWGTGKYLSLRTTAGGKDYTDTFAIPASYLGETAKELQPGEMASYPAGGYPYPFRTTPSELTFQATFQSPGHYPRWNRDAQRTEDVPCWAGKVTSTPMTVTVKALKDPADIAAWKVMQSETSPEWSASFAVGTKFGEKEPSDKRFHRVLSEYPKSVFAKHCAYALAVAYAERIDSGLDDRLRNTVRYATQAVDASSHFSDDAELLLAEAYLRRGKFYPTARLETKARRHLEHLLTTWPNSDSAVRAKEVLATLEPAGRPVPPATTQAEAGELRLILRVYRPEGAPPEKVQIVVVVQNLSDREAVLPVSWATGPFVRDNGAAFRLVAEKDGVELSSNNPFTKPDNGPGERAVTLGPTDSFTWSETMDLSRITGRIGPGVCLLTAHLEGFGRYPVQYLDPETDQPVWRPCWKGVLKSESVKVEAPAPPATQPDQADLPLPTGYMPLDELAPTSQGILVARLQSIGRGDVGPPGASDYDSVWTVVKVFRGDYAGDLRMSFRVQTIPEKHRQRMPVVGKTYILLMYPKPSSPTQIASIFEETGAKLAEIQKLAGLPGPSGGTSTQPEERAAPPATQPEVKWGQAVGGLKFGLMTAVAEAPMGAKLEFDLHLQLDPKEADPKVDAIHGRKPYWFAVNFRFTDVKTGKVFQRDPFNGAWGPPPAEAEVVSLLRPPFKPVRREVYLMTPDGQHIPPGTYSVTAECDINPRAVKYDPPQFKDWSRFWAGKVVSGPIVLTVKPAEPKGVDVKIPSSLAFPVDEGYGLCWSWSRKDPAIVRMKVRPGFRLTSRFSGRAFLDGKELPLGGQEGGLPYEGHSSFDGRPFPPDVTNAVLRGGKLRVVADLEVIETSVYDRAFPPGPVLWKGSVEGTVTQKDVPTLTAQPIYDYGKEVDGLQTRLVLASGQEANDYDLVLYPRNVSGKPIQLAAMVDPWKHLRVTRDGKFDLPIKKKRTNDPEFEGDSLKPGESTELSTRELSAIVRLSEPGTYTLQWAAPAAKEADDRRFPPPSNIVTLKVTRQANGKLTVTVVPEPIPALDKNLGPTTQPATQPAADAAEPGVGEIKIMVLKDGYAIETVAYESVEQLVAAVKKRAAGKITLPVRIAADPQAKYDRIVEMLNLLSKAGFKRISFGSLTAPPATQPAGRLVFDPVANVEAVKPKDWVVQKVEENAYPSHFVAGKGKAIYLGPPGRESDPGHKQMSYESVVWIMPGDYSGALQADGHFQKPAAELIATLADAKVYVWGLSAWPDPAAAKAGIQAAVNAYPTTQPAGGGKSELLVRLARLGVTPETTRRMVFAGGDGDFGGNTRVEAAPDMRKAVWNAVAVAQPFSRISFSGYRRVEFYTVTDAAKPAALLFVNVTDASHLEGQDEDRFRCAGLTELTEPLLRAEYERHHPPATQPAEAGGLKCRLEATAASVPMGTKVVFKLHLEFDPTAATDPKVNLLNRCDEAWKARVEFTNARTGDVYIRSPYDAGMSPVGPNLHTLAFLRGKPLDPDTLDIRLLGNKGEQIPPGTYRVAATYLNTAEPEVEAYVGDKDALLTRPYEGPWKFWKGTITSGPIVVRVEKAEPEDLKLKVNSTLVVKLEDGRVAWQWGQDKPTEVAVKRRPGYVVGSRHDLHVFLNDKEVPYGGGGLAGGVWHNDSGSSFLPDRIAERVLAGERLRLVADIKVFETSVPVQHMWSPEAGDFKVLWTGEVEGTLAAPPATQPEDTPAVRARAVKRIVQLLDGKPSAFDATISAIEEASKLVSSRPPGANMAEFEPMVEPLFRHANWGGIGDQHWHMAASVLVRIGQPALPLLKTKLESKNYHDRWSAMDIISRIGKPQSVVLASARSLLTDRDDYVRRTAIESLGRLGAEAKEAVKDLEGLSNDESEFNQVCVQLALIHIQGPSETRIRAIASHLTSKDKGSTAHYAAEVLGDLGEPARIALPELLEALSSADANTRNQATFAIGKTGTADENAIAALIDRLKNDTDVEVRRTAAGALGNIGPKVAAAIPALREAATNGANEVRGIAEDAIRRISAPPATQPATHRIEP